jgi:hypothetical protein
VHSINEFAGGTSQHEQSHHICCSVTQTMFSNSRSSLFIVPSSNHVTGYILSPPSTPQSHHSVALVFCTNLCHGCHHYMSQQLRNQGSVIISTYIPPSPTRYHQSLFLAHLCDFAFHIADLISRRDSTLRQPRCRPYLFLALGLCLLCLCRW